MIYKEEKKDLFKVSDRYHLVHCISADLALGAGIAATFNRKYDLRGTLKENYPDYIMNWIRESKSYDCLQEGNVFNLVTKTRYYNKPTYSSITGSLVKLRDICIRQNIKYLAMPKIGCGLDRLMWDRVSWIIKDTFADTDIEILVCIR